MIKVTKDAVTERRADTQYRATVDGRPVGTVYRRETTKTGFKYGRCVGQVPCKRWFYRLDGRFGEIGGDEGRSSWLGSGFSTRAAAVEHMETRIPAEVPRV